jgi:diacylglycerol kinase family enzyme
VRISLLYNEAAGDRVTVEAIVHAIERHGHELVRITDNRTQSGRLLEDTPDLVVAAGGDGTVAAAARLVSGTDTPFTLLPLGTANNIAKSLGVVGTLDALVSRWSDASHDRLDIGTVTGSWGSDQFVEGMGGGWIVCGIDMMHARPAEEDPDKKVGRALHVHGEALATLVPEHYQLTIDGTGIDGDFLLVAILNMPSIGPNLVLSGDVSPSDGWLSVVIADERHRAELGRFLHGRKRDARNGAARDPSHPAESDAPELLHLRARHIELRGDYRLHVDDELRRASGTTTVGILPAAVAVLLPREPVRDR